MFDQHPTENLIVDALSPNAETRQKNLLFLEKKKDLWDEDSLKRFHERKHQHIRSWDDTSLDHAITPFHSALKSLCLTETDRLDDSLFHDIARLGQILFTPLLADMIVLAVEHNRPDLLTKTLQHIPLDDAILPSVLMKATTETTPLIMAALRRDCLLVTHPQTGRVVFSPKKESPLFQMALGNTQSLKVWAILLSAYAPDHNRLFDRLQAESLFLTSVGQQLCNLKGDVLLELHDLHNSVRNSAHGRLGLNRVDTTDLETLMARHPTEPFFGLTDPMPWKRAVPDSQSFHILLTSSPEHKA